MNRWRRHLVKAMLLFVGGAVVNVAVACTLHIRQSQVAALRMMVHDDVFPTRVSWTGKNERGLLAGGVYYLVQDGVRRRTNIGFGMEYLQQCVEPGQLTRFEHRPAMENRVEVGWPVRAWSTGWNQSGFILLSPRGIATRIAVTPMWSGFAINALFYAAIVWLLFAAPFVVRRHLRTMRGLCPACAYPRGASDVCTECGGRVRLSGDIA
jgi:hypothetical protein